MAELNYRFNQIRNLIPSDVKSALDVGCDDRSMEPCFEKYIGLDVQNAEIIQDLNLSQKIPLPDKSVDLVILSQILEHLSDPTELVAESKRVSRKYVLIGLPNEYTLDNRFRILFNIHGRGYEPYGHKHFFNPQTAESFVKQFFGGWEKKEYIFAVKGGRLLPQPIRQFLADIYPSLFAKEVYWLYKQ